MHLNTKSLKKNPCPSTKLDINKFFERSDNNISDVIDIMTPNIKKSEFYVKNHTPDMTKLYNLEDKKPTVNMDTDTRLNRYFNKSRNIFNIPDFVLHDNGGL